MAQKYIVVDFGSGKTDWTIVYKTNVSVSKILSSMLFPLPEIVDDRLRTEERKSAESLELLDAYFIETAKQTDDVRKRNLNYMLDESWRTWADKSFDWQKRISEAVNRLFDSFMKLPKKSSRDILDFPCNVSEPYMNYYDSFCQFIWKNQFFSTTTEKEQVVGNLVDQKNRKPEFLDDGILLCIVWLEWMHQISEWMDQMLMTACREFVDCWNLMSDLFDEVNASRKVFSMQIEPKEYSGKRRNRISTNSYAPCKLNSVEKENPTSKTKKLSVYLAEKRDSGMSEKQCMRMTA